MKRLHAARTVVLVGCIAWAAGACGGRGAGGHTDAGAARQGRVVEIHSSLSGFPPGLTNDQVLDQLVQPPSASGFVKGVVTGAGTVVAVKDLSGPARAFTDFPLRILGFVGPGPNPYATGSTITLRVPGGALDGTVYEDADAPAVRPSQVVYVFVRNQGVIGGGNTATRVVAAIGGQDVFYDNDGTISGAARFAPDRWSEPEAAFVAHFQNR